jgi:RNA 2',3'-cyclic 3'-phosphodiesterase
MRLFIAVAVPQQVAGELESAVAPLRSSWPSLRWTGRDAWHLTLAFLGEVSDAAATRLAGSLGAAAADHPSLALSLGGAGAFPAAHRAHVLWTGVRGDEAELRALAASVAGKAAKVLAAPESLIAEDEGVPAAEEGRDFQPHLTLARSRAAVDVRPLVAELAGYAGTPWTAEEIYLIQSRLQARPRYETLGSWPLGGPPAAGGGAAPRT